VTNPAVRRLIALIEDAGGVWQMDSESEDEFSFAFPGTMATVVVTMLEPAEAKKRELYLVNREEFIATIVNRTPPSLFDK
jgi:hypothetical protein